MASSRADEARHCHCHPLIDCLRVQRIWRLWMGKIADVDYSAHAKIPTIFRSQRETKAFIKGWL